MFIDLPWFAEYQRQALVTAPNLDTAAKLRNAALGLCGESGEIADLVKKHRFQGHALDTAKIADEIGDVLWYTALAMSAMEDIDPTPDYNADRQRTLLEDDLPLHLRAIVLCNNTSGAALALDRYARFVERQWPTNTLPLLYSLFHYVSYLADIAAAIGTTLEQCANANIAKLRRRYPDGFDAQRSMQRDGSQ